MISRKSFNIKYDVGNSEILEGYYATSSHSNVIRNVIDGILEGKQRAHIAYGPYGSGKSFISTILINILSKNFNSTDLLFLSKKFEKVDTGISQRFEKMNKVQTRYIPVLLNGYEGDFQSSIIRALFKAMRNNKLDIYSSGTASKVREIINNWEISFPEAYRKFLDYILSEKISKYEFMSKLQENSQTVIKFDQFYKEITFGASLPDNADENLIDVLEHILKRLQELNLGIFIVFDEFGRLLQNVKTHEVNGFMEQLQSIAELANTGSTNLSVLFVAHKPIGHYFQYLDREARSEFSKIEKRFSVSEIRSDNNTFILITQEVILKKRKVCIDPDHSADQSRSLNKFRLFSSSMNDTEIENKIIRDCYPLHPVTLFSLPRISNIFGQNERTLFTFLYDESAFGLSGFLNREKGYFYPDLLVDYFFSTLENSELENIKDVALYRKVLSQMKGYFESEDIEDAYRILKFCFLWNITNSNGYTTLTPNFISYSIGIPLSRAEILLQILFDRKVLRVNAVKKNIEIIEASAVNLDIEIAKQISLQEGNTNLVNTILNQLNPIKYFYATNYNNLNDLTRFAEVELNFDNFEQIDFSKNNHDVLIKIAISDQEISDIVTLSETLINGSIRIDTTKVVQSLKRIAALFSLSNNRQFLAEYRNVELEINHEISLAQNKLSEFYKKIFTKDLSLASKGKVFRVKNSSQLADEVNKHIELIYSKPIIIHNDQINMFVISNIQERAIIKVIDLIIKSGSIELEKCFDGNKPEYLVFYSIKHSNYYEIRKEIREYIMNNETASLSDVYNIMKNPPFGIRSTLLSLIFVFSTYDMWKNIMFFNNENFIAELPAENLFFAGKGIYNYQYSYSNFEFENRYLLEKIVKDFGKMSVGVQNKSLTIMACSCLYNWYLNLPVIVQLGNCLGLRERYFTRAIEKAKTSPKDSILSIIELVNDDYNSLDEIKNNVEGAFRQYIENFEKKLMESFRITSWNEWAYEQNDILKRSNDFVKLCISTSDFVRDYARSIDALEIERWPNAMFDVFRDNVMNIHDKINNRIDSIELQINGKIKHISNVTLSNKSSLLKTNLLNLIEANKKYVTKSEIEKVVIEIVEEILKTEEI